MRNYYTKAGILSRDPRTPVASIDAHWVIFHALVLGVDDDWRPEIKQSLCQCCEARDVSLLFSTLGLLEDQHNVNLVNLTTRTVRFDRQVLCYLKKFPFTAIESPFDTRATAISKCLDAEKLCQATNERMRSYESSELPRFVQGARELIHDVLGELTPQLVLKICRGGKHGPGATLSSQGNRTTPYYKYADLPYSVTAAAAPYALCAISQSPRWLEHLESSGRRRVIPDPRATQAIRERMLFDDCVDIVKHDRITFVPKDAKTDRPIAVGASLNMFLQLGVKSYLQDRLKLVGVDLDDQTKNQEMAHAGSRYCSHLDGVNHSQFSTIDLASASDTISYETVKMLLPLEWFAFLCDLRHQSGSLGEEILDYEKFSAMGNGFTFPLESLVFWALTKASIQAAGLPCQQKDIAVYGDDIIVRYFATDVTLQALNWAGFVINQEKSFLSGPFKESCGADFFKGQNVRPFYLKRRIETYEDVYFTCNSIAKQIISQGTNRALVQAYYACLQLVPRRQRRFAPLAEGYEEVGLQVPYAYLANLGLRPWLEPDEQRHLLCRRLLLSEDAYLHSNYVVVTQKSAIVYHGKASLRYAISLEQRESGTANAHFYTREEDLLFVEAARAGVVTRRKAVRRRHTVVPILHWDGRYTKRGNTTAHPIWNAP